VHVHTPSVHTPNWPMTPTNSHGSPSGTPPQGGEVQIIPPASVTPVHSSVKRSHSFPPIVQGIVQISTPSTKSQAKPAAGGQVVGSQGWITPTYSQKPPLQAQSAGFPPIAHSIASTQGSAQKPASPPVVVPLPEDASLEPLPDDASVVELLPVDVSLLEDVSLVVELLLLEPLPVALPEESTLLLEGGGPELVLVSPDSLVPTGSSVESPHAVVASHAARSKVGRGQASFEGLVRMMGRS
jgi:hypothetical protein